MHGRIRTALLARPRVPAIIIEHRAADFRRIERRWVRDYRGRSATSADFIELASRVSGQDLTEFLNAWLYGDTTPPMPGHPDWVVIPAASAAARSATSADLPARFPLPGAARHAAGLHKH